MRTFYFNTGVKQHGHNPPVPLMPGQVWKGGVKQIPFECSDVPHNATFMFACSQPDLAESKFPNWIVRRIRNSTLVSEYAYFKLPGRDLTAAK
jgi:hypothetical protein